jgi:hypothetical protein
MAESPIRILLVEDNPADARLFGCALELSGAPHSLDIVIRLGRVRGINKTDCPILVSGGATGLRWCA